MCVFTFTYEKKSLQKLVTLGASEKVNWLARDLGWVRKTIYYFLLWIFALHFLILKQMDLLAIRTFNDTF